MGATSVHQAKPLYWRGNLLEDPAPPPSELQEGLVGSQTLSWQLQAVTQSQVPWVPKSKHNNAHADSSPVTGHSCHSCLGTKAKSQP